jgi:hypothetical protein
MATKSIISDGWREAETKVEIATSISYPGKVRITFYCYDDEITALFDPIGARRLAETIVSHSNEVEQFLAQEKV